MAGPVSSAVRGHHGLEPWSVRSDYKSYKSPYAPAYKFQPHYHGVSVSRLARFGFTAAGFGAVAGTFALFFFAEVPRVSSDIMQKVPLIGDMFIKQTPPEDNPF